MIFPAYFWSNELDSRLDKSSKKGTTFINTDTQHIFLGMSFLHTLKYHKYIWSNVKFEFGAVKAKTSQDPKTYHIDEFRNF